MKVPDAVNRDALPDNHRDKNQNGNSQQDHCGDEVSMEVGFGEYSNIEAEDRHLDEVDLDTVKDFSYVICQRHR